MIAAELGLDDEQVEQVRMAGRLHDIGKIGIREEILNKQGPLTADEYEHVKQHVVIGSQILAPLAHLGDIIAFVRSHHERWDGQGYPDGLQGEEIPLGARILAAAEIYDALTTSRPYQEKMPPEVAVERMRDLAGTVLDPDGLSRRWRRRCAAGRPWSSLMMHGPRPASRHSRGARANVPRWRPAVVVATSAAATLVREPASPCRRECLMAKLVLVIEDDPDQRRLLERMLAGGGWRVVTAPTARPGCGARAEPAVPTPSSWT